MQNGYIRMAVYKITSLIEMQSLDLIEGSGLLITNVG